MPKGKKMILLKDRRGQATVIGSVFFFMIAVTLIYFIYEIAQNQIVMQHQDAERVTETVNSEILVLPEGNLAINVENRGPIPVKLIGLWVIDKTDNNHIRYDIPDEKSDVFPWEEIEIHTDEDMMNPPWDPLNDENEYSIRLVTARGNIIEARPFQAISGETIGAGAYPPWVSLGESEFIWESEETPIISISDKPDDDVAYTGGKGYLSLKNTAEITFYLTFNSRVVFKSISETETSYYSSRLSKWFVYTDFPDWDEESRGDISYIEDSKAIRKDDVIILEFLTPKDSEVGSIQSDEYRVYLHISGYDESGNTYYQSIHYGTIRIE